MPKHDQAMVETSPYFRLIDEEMYTGMEVTTTLGSRSGSPNIR